VADAKETDDRDGGDRIDGLMTNLARARVAVGVAALAAPRIAARVSGTGQGADAGRDYVIRMFAAREIALGAGYLLGGDDAVRRHWARLGLAVDALDVFSALRTRPGLPLWVTAGGVGVAGAAAGIGAAKVVREILG
jgi:hypothetical protein